MKLIDLHCDTAYRVHKENALLKSNRFHISLEKITKYENFAQIMAIFINNKLSDEDGYNSFFEIYGYLSAELAENKNTIARINDGSDLPRIWESERAAAILSVEDARLLSGKIERLDVLYSRGVRLLVLLWAGESCIGGSHNTEAGLTRFGREVVYRCFELGIVPDISHASERSAQDVISIAKECRKPVIASHSNSYTVYPHTRNLRDPHFEAVRDLGGVVGISLCSSHLAPGGQAEISDAVKHMSHYISLGGEDTITLGCDLDGTDLPCGIEDVTDLDKISFEMKHAGFSDLIIEKIFWRNAERFLTENIR